MAEERPGNRSAVLTRCVSALQPFEPSLSVTGNSICVELAFYLPVEPEGRDLRGELIGRLKAATHLLASEMQSVPRLPGACAPCADESA